MQHLNAVTVDEHLKLVQPEHTGTVTTTPEPDNDYAQIVMAIERLLCHANLSSENQFTVVVDVQGSSDSGRIVQLTVLDAHQGPLLF